MQNAKQDLTHSYLFQEIQNQTGVKFHHVVDEQTILGLQSFY